MNLDILECGKKVFEIEIQELNNIKNRLDHNFKMAVETLYEIANEGGKLIIIGVGKSGNIGQKISATFTSTGMPSIIMDATNALHGDLGIINKNDAVILLSFSGETEELIKSIPHIKRFAKKTIAMTGKSESTLAKSCDILLNISIQKEACPLNLAPTSSTTATLVMGDALAMALLSARGFKEEDFAMYHPSGQLGSRLLTPVSKIMRTGEHIAICSEKNSVSECLTSMTKARCGAVILIDSDSKLSGIFTQGDFVRNFQKNPMLDKDSVINFMTKNPLKVNQNDLVNILLKRLEENKVDDVVVVDNDDLPVGLVDTQDLSRYRII